MSAKFKKGLARSHTLSDISDFTSSQTSSIPCGGLLCDSLEFVRMSGSKNSGGCSSLLSKMNIGREASSDYDLDQPDGPTEELDAPTNNQVMKKSKFSHFKPSTFANSNGDDQLEGTASPQMKGSKIFSPCISKRAYSPYKNGGKLNESSALYNSCQIDSSCSRSLRIAKENRKALGVATSTDDASLSDEYPSKVILNEYTPATVSRLNSITYKLSKAKRSSQQKHLCKYIKQKLRIINREPTAAITLSNEQNTSNQNWISMPHGGTGSSILYSHPHYLSMYRMDVDQLQLKDIVLSSDDSITCVIPLDSHFPHVLLVSTLSGKLQLHKYQPLSRDYQLKLSLQPLDVDSQTYPTSLAQYKSTFYIGCSDGSLAVFDFKTRKIMFSIQGENKPKPYIPNGTELSPKIVGQRNNNNDGEDDFKENTSEFKFEMNMQEYSSNSLDEAFTSGKKQVVNSPYENRESSDNKKEMIPQELGVKGIVVRDEMLAYWTSRNIKVISRLDPENFVYESEHNDLIQCNFSLQSSQSLLILTEQSLDIVYLPAKKIIFSKKAQAQNCCVFKGFAMNTQTKEIALLSHNSFKQTSTIEIMSFSSGHLRSIDVIEANYVFNSIHFDHTKQLLFATTDTQLKAFQFFNKQTHISLQSQLLKTVHQTGQDIPSFESNQAGQQTQADPSNQPVEDFITISNF